MGLTATLDPHARRAERAERGQRVGVYIGLYLV